MRIRSLHVRVAVVTVTVAVVSALALPIATQKMTANGYSSLLHYYFDKLAEPLLHLQINWTIVKIGLAVSFSGLALELLILGWQRSSLRRLVRFEDKSTVNDIFYWIVGVLKLGGFIRFYLTFGAASVIAYLIGRLNLDLRLVYHIESPLLQYLTAFLVMDFFGYFQHRLAHRWGWWWELHKIHHSAEKFNMVTYYRTHFLESLPRAVIYGVAMAVFGNWNHFIFYYFVLELISMFVHSEVQYKWGWLEKYLLVSPRNHKIHHSIHPEHHDKNFGFTLIIWDRMFGTWCEPKDGESIEIGLKHNEFNHTNPIWDLLLAYKNCVAAMFRTRPQTGAAVRKISQ